MKRARVLQTMLTGFLLGALLWGGQAAPAVARLSSAATVNGPDILLGEIAEIVCEDEDLLADLESLPVGKAALPGGSRQLLLGSIRVRLRQAGIPEKAVLLESDQDPVQVMTAQVKQTPMNGRKGAVAAAAGTAVELVMSAGAVRVADAGELLADAALGERVAVRNTRTGATVMGLLVTPGLVEVKSR